MTTIATTPAGGLHTLVVKDGGAGIELYGPYRDAVEQEEYRREWREQGALVADSEVALRLIVRGTVEVERF